jgi:hypothetical protein
LYDAERQDEEPEPELLVNETKRPDKDMDIHIPFFFKKGRIRDNGQNERRKESKATRNSALTKKPLQRTHQRRHNRRLQHRLTQLGEHLTRKNSWGRTSFPVPKRKHKREQ